VDQSTDLRVAVADLVPRLARGLLDELVSALRIVIVNGPRQSGKTTMLRQYQRGARQLPDARHLPGPGGGDWLVRAIKIAVDDDPRAGRFIPSVSSRFLTVPTLSESLAGCAAFVDLWPLSMAEITGGPADFLSRVFSEPASLRGAESAWTRDEYIRAICSGGYPEVRGLRSPIAPRAWYDGYLTTVINRDISDFAEIGKAQAIPRLLGPAASALTRSAAAPAGRRTGRGNATYADLRSGTRN
jgi:predicted AAA+ superfamily ATPase